MSFVTITKSQGVNGHMYFYYRTNRIVFALYKLVVALGALFTIVRLSFFVYKDDKVKIITTFIHFVIFIVLLIICEVYLETRFVGKG